MPLIYAFRGVTDEELEAYVSFYETPAGQWYVKASTAAKHAAWLDATIRVARAGLSTSP